MPTLKNLKCSIEIGADNIPLQEYGTTFQDGFVQSFVAMPPNPSKFSVHLTSDSYIAPGLGMFVFVDSVFQCNRVRRGLKLPDANSKPYETLIDFRVRQKEERVSKGMYIARDWILPSIGKGEVKSGSSVDKISGENLGCIEVVVLRCCEDVKTAIPLAQADPAPDPATLATPAQVSATIEKPKTSVKDPSHHESGKKASVKSVASSIGLMGLFDGANDNLKADSVQAAAKHRPYIKQYWAEWKPKKSSPSDKQQAYVITDAAQLVAGEAAGHSSQRLSNSKAAMYSHKTTSPKYMDTMDRPYAVFWFGFRTKDVIEKMLNIKISDPTPDERAALMKMSKDELISQLIKSRQKSSAEPKASSVKQEGKDQPGSAGQQMTWAGLSKEKPVSPQDKDKQSTVKADETKASIQQAKEVTKLASAKAPSVPREGGSQKAASFINLGTTKGNLDWSKEPEGDWGAAPAADTAAGWDAQPAGGIGDWGTGNNNNDTGWNVDGMGARNLNMGKLDTAAAWGEAPDPQEYAGL